MPNVEDLLGSNTITVDAIKNSPTKRAIVLSAGTIKEDEFGNTRWIGLVEIDGKQKFYKPNKTSLTNLSGEWGNLTESWVGKAMIFRVDEIKSREAVIAVPEGEAKEKVSKGT